MPSCRLFQIILFGKTASKLEISRYIIVVFLSSTGYVVPDKFSFNVSLFHVSATF